MQLPITTTIKAVTLIGHIYYVQKNNNKWSVSVTSGNIFSDNSNHLPSALFLFNNSSHNIKCKYLRPSVRLFTSKNKDKFQECL